MPRLYTWTVLENHVHLLPTLQERALTYAQTHFWYAAKLLYPRQLAFDYGFACLPTVHSLADPRNLLPLLAYSLLLALVMWTMYSPRPSALALGLALLTLPMVG